MTIINPSPTPQPRPATEPWSIPNPTNTRLVVLASVLPAILALILSSMLHLAGPVGLLLVFMPLQIIAAGAVGVRIYGRKGFADAMLIIFTIFFSSLVAVMLLSVLWSVISQGFKALSPQFLLQNNKYISSTTDLAFGGVGHAIIGTLLIVGLTTLVTVPLGVAIAVYLTETRDRGRNAVRTLLQALSGLPSVVAGLFVYSALIVTGVTGYAGWAGSLALMPLMLPTVARVAEEALRLVPMELRTGALALGAPAYRAFFMVTLPAAKTGLVTACLLGVARVIGETAPLLLTINSRNETSFDLGAPMASLPTYVYQYISNSYDTSIQRAWGAALVILMLVAILFASARLLSGAKKSNPRKRK